MKKIVLLILSAVLLSSCWLNKSTEEVDVKKIENPEVSNHKEWWLGHYREITKEGSELSMKKEDNTHGKNSDNYWKSKWNFINTWSKFIEYFDEEKNRDINQFYFNVSNLEDKWEFVFSWEWYCFNEDKQKDTYVNLLSKCNKDIKIESIKILPCKENFSEEYNENWYEIDSEKIEDWRKFNYNVSAKLNNLCNIPYKFKFTFDNWEELSFLKSIWKDDLEKYNKIFVKNNIVKYAEEKKEVVNKLKILDSEFIRISSIRDNFKKDNSLYVLWSKFNDEEFYNKEEEW